MADAAVGEFFPAAAHHLPESGNLAHGLYKADLGILVKVSDSRAVVAAVFQTGQTV